MFVRSAQILAVYHIHSPRTAWRPPTDVYETETNRFIEIEISGMRDGHFHVTLQGHTLLVYGTRPAATRERRTYHQMEINTGDFRVELELSEVIDASALQADYDDGYLLIRLPKTPV